MKNKKLFISFVYIMAFALFLGFTFACEAADKDIVATLNGTNITLDEFKEAVRYNDSALARIPIYCISLLYV
jgi:hypothetical protein